MAYCAWTTQKGLCSIPHLVSKICIGLLYTCWLGPHSHSNSFKLLHKRVNPGVGDLRTRISRAVGTHHVTGIYVEDRNRGGTWPIRKQEERTAQGEWCLEGWRPYRSLNHMLGLASSPNIATFMSNKTYWIIGKPYGVDIGIERSPFS